MFDKVLKCDWEKVCKNVKEWTVNLTFAQNIPTFAPSSSSCDIWIYEKDLWASLLKKTQEEQTVFHIKCMIRIIPHICHFFYTRLKISTNMTNIGANMRHGQDPPRCRQQRTIRLEIIRLKHKEDKLHFETMSKSKCHKFVCMHAPILDCGRFFWVIKERLPVWTRRWHQWGMKTWQQQPQGWKEQINLGKFFSVLKLPKLQLLE